MKELSEDSKLQVSIKTLGGIAMLIFAFVGMWFSLQASISEAKDNLFRPVMSCTKPCVAI